MDRLAAVLGLGGGGGGGGGVVETREQQELQEQQQEHEEQQEQQEQQQEHQQQEEEQQASHRFDTAVPSAPTACNVCRQALWTVRSAVRLGVRGGAAVRCAVCGLAAHQVCARLVADAGAPAGEPAGAAASSSSAGAPAPAPAGELGRLVHPRWTSLACRPALFTLCVPPLPHHLVESNTMDFAFGDAPCAVCGRGFALFQFFVGARCSRCGVLVHEACAPSLGECCPRHANLLATRPRDVSGPGGGLQLIEEESARRPLLVFVNGRSGGGRLGERLVATFARLLDPCQVFDMQRTPPGPCLERFRRVRNLRVLACGGDGTACWVLSEVGRVWAGAPASSFPPVAVLPLGTGNDLARTLGWGAGYSGSEDLDYLLERVGVATPVPFDRWAVELPGERRTLTMNNYLSLGVDAQIALEFHQLREEQPMLFPSQLVNKMWYGSFGLKSIFSGVDQLQSTLRVVVDGVPVSLAAVGRSVGGLVVLNIPSFGAGADLWGDAVDEAFPAPQSFSDRQLEVVGVTGSLQLALNQANLAQPVRLARGHEIVIHTTAPLPMQIDGEPFVQPPGEVVVRLHGQVTVLVNEADRPVRSDSELRRLQQENAGLRRQVKQLVDEVLALRAAQVEEKDGGANDSAAARGGDAHESDAPR